MELVRAAAGGSAAPPPQQGCHRLRWPLQPLLPRHTFTCSPPFNTSLPPTGMAPAVSKSREDLRRCGGELQGTSGMWWDLCIMSKRQSAAAQGAQILRERHLTASSAGGVWAFGALLTDLGLITG